MDFQFWAHLSHKASSQLFLHLWFSKAPDRNIKMVSLIVWLLTKNSVYHTQRKHAVIGIIVLEENIEWC